MRSELLAIYDADHGSSGHCNPDGNAGLPGHEYETKKVRGLMKRWLILAIFLLSAFGAVAQTPTKVQTIYCPNSGVAGSGTGGSQTNGVYICPFAEPTLSSNFISVDLFYAPA